MTETGSFVNVVIVLNIVTEEKILMKVKDVTLEDEISTSPRNVGSRLPVPTASCPKQLNPQTHDTVKTGRL
jgi:hypothetical protein